MRKSATRPAGRTASARNAVGSTRRSTRTRVRHAGRPFPLTRPMGNDGTLIGGNGPRRGGWRVTRRFHSVRAAGSPGAAGSGSGLGPDHQPVRMPAIFHRQDVLVTVQPDLRFVLAYLVSLPPSYQGRRAAVRSAAGVSMKMPGIEGMVRWTGSRGRVALVTGSASGVGAATARRFASEGAAVLVTDIQARPGPR